MRMPLTIRQAGDLASLAEITQGKELAEKIRTGPHA